MFKSIWDRAELYKDTHNPWLQKIDLVGRYHGQYWAADSEGNHADGWSNRRMYLGINSRFLHNFTLEAQVSLNDRFDPLYKGLYDAFIQWEDDDKTFAVSVGRLDYVYTGLERSTSSKRIKTMERALLVGQLMPGEVVGIYLKDKELPFAWQVGLFSGNIEQEFTDFSAGFSALLGLQHSLPLFFDTGTLHLDYLYNNGNQDNNAFKPYRSIVSLWHQGSSGPLELGIDLTAAWGIQGQSDVFGLTLLPTHDLIRDLLIDGDRLQLALRYHYATSSEGGGLDFARRYQQPVSSGSGDRYNSFYLGLNYYIHGQMLKLMTGIEYFTMDGVIEDPAVGDESRVDGWNFITGIRLYF